LTKVLGTFAVAALALGTSASAQTPAQVYPVHSGPVTITSCSIGQAGNNVAKGSVEIKYFQNVPTRHLSSITFRINYNHVKIDVTDTGTFSFQAPIDHKFDSPVLDSLTYAGADPDICRVLTATFGDGQIVKPPYGGMGKGMGHGMGNGGPAAGASPGSDDVGPGSDSTNASPAPKAT
jgi:hypothetical protein